MKGQPTAEEQLREFQNRESLDQLCAGCLMFISRKGAPWHRYCAHGCEQVVQCHREWCTGRRDVHTCGICGKEGICKGNQWYLDTLFCLTCRIAVCKECATKCDSCGGQHGPACPKCKPGPLDELENCTVCAQKQRVRYECKRCVKYDYDPDAVTCAIPGCGTWVCPHKDGDKDAETGWGDLDDDDDAPATLLLCDAHKDRVPIRPPCPRDAPVAK